MSTSVQSPALALSGRSATLVQGGPLHTVRNHLITVVTLLGLTWATAGCGALAEILHTNPMRVTGSDPGGLYPAFLHARPRVVAIGDIHGDLGAARAALVMAGAIDAKDRWIGGDLVVVQVGDILDRGDGEKAILDLLHSVEQQARAKGGRLIQLLGNHEAMNALGDFRYVTVAGMGDFDPAPGVALSAPGGGAGGLGPTLGEAVAPDVAGARRKAFQPGGPWARRLARLAVAVRVGDSVFVHAGLLPRYARQQLTSLNKAMRMWLQGGAEAPAWVNDSDGPLWTRAYAKGDEQACATLGKALALLKASRMVIGHTVQRGGITNSCDGALWRIDTGMSSAFGGPIEVLELTPTRVQPIRSLPQR